MSFNIRDYVSDDHIESIGEIATGQARIIQALSLDNSQKDKEIERLNKKLNIQEEKFKKWNKVLNDENHRLKNIIKEQKETIKELQEDIDILTSDDDNDSVWLENENM